MKTKLNYYEYQNRTVCPYCETIINNENSCCGESSAHFETRVVDDATETEMYHPDTVEFYRPIRDVIQYEILIYLKNSYLLKSLIRNKVRRLRNVLCNLYDGVTWSNGDCKDTLIKRLRIASGLQWSALDRLILRQLHDFPLYYNKPQK